MATYKDIQEWVRSHCGFVPQTCWIGHCKEINKIPLIRTPPKKRVKPCPSKKQPCIERAFRHFRWM